MDKQKDYLQAINKMRQNLLNEAAQAYVQFLDRVRPIINSPFHQAQAFIRFDEGHFWLNQSILNAPIDLEPVNLEPTKKAKEATN